MSIASITSPMSVAFFPFTRSKCCTGWIACSCNTLSHPDSAGFYQFP